MNIEHHKEIESQLPIPESIKIWRAVQSLKSVISFMSTGAHPDDETSEMLAALAHRDGLNLSYACSTRGEGGQNALGRERGRDLGMIRAAEMDLACDILNMKMYWLAEPDDVRIYDFGFSKNGVDTMARWGHMHLLRQFVRIIRTERPDIICPTFLDVPGQHGHHRAMTLAAHEAFDLAANADAFPELGLKAWTVSKLYLPAWGGGGQSYDDEVPPPEETVAVDASGIEAQTGYSWAQIAQQSRYQHKTQGMGVWVEADQPSRWPLHLAASRVGSDRGCIRDNLPIRLKDISARYGEIDKACDVVIKAWPDTDAMTGAVQDALAVLQKLDTEAEHRLSRKAQQLTHILALLSGEPDEDTSTGKPSLGKTTRVVPDKIALNLELADRDIAFACHVNGGGTAQVMLPDDWKTSEKGATLPDDIRADLYEFGVRHDGTPAIDTITASYPHIGVVSRQKLTKLSILPLKISVPSCKIGFISGYSGRPDHWLSQVGMDITEISDAMLKPGVFDAFDTILVGAFGFGARPALLALRKELHDWVRGGGNLVTLYHRPWDSWKPDSTPPEHLKIGQPSLRWRITDEKAAVTHLLPDHPLLNTPNRIGPQDWRDWHKERGLYFASEWSDAYAPLLSMADPDEDPLLGALLSAKIGKGRHTHTALLLEHQLEMLVPGAFRLLANLLAAGN